MISNPAKKLRRDVIVVKQGQDIRSSAWIHFERGMKCGDFSSSKLEVYI